MNQKIVAVIIIVLVVSLVVGVVYAVSSLTLTSNDSDPITPMPLPTVTPTASPSPSPSQIEYTLTLAWNTTTPYLGESVQFTATLTPATENVTVFFYRKSPTQTLLGNATTDSEGKAVFNTLPLSNEAAKVFNANCTLTIP